MSISAADIAQVFREEHGRAVSVLIRVLGDIELAEDAVQDAFATAIEKWPRMGIPPSPAGWIITTARRRAIDQLRREAGRDERHLESARLLQQDEAQMPTAIQDERLRLMFICAHPSLSMEARVALTLRQLGGLSTPEIARAFLQSEQTVAQRIVRAKKKIRENGIRYELPPPSHLPERLDGVLAVLYLIFNEGYVASTGDRLTRPELCAEAIRLARAARELLPKEPEVAGLLALLLLTEARRPARVDADGNLVRLADQDRGLWDGDLIREGQALVRWCLDAGNPGAYQIQAAIAAVHTDSTGAESTDWPAILALYDQLIVIQPSPVVALNRCVAVGEVSGPFAGLREIDRLGIDGHHAWHVVRAEFLARLGHDARPDLMRAAELTTNEVERRHLLQQAMEI